MAPWHTFRAAFDRIDQLTQAPKEVKQKEKKK
jgi:hypothetical protein